MRPMLATLVLMLSLTVHAQEGVRLALVVGINHYDRLSPLKGAVSDAHNMAAFLQASGYDYVWTLTDDAEIPSARPSLVNFQIHLDNVERLAEVQRVDELTLFFAGHGVQIGGENFLCFPEADLGSRRGMLSVDRELLPFLRRTPARLALTFLDACREDLGPSRAAGVTRGLVIPEQIAVGQDRNILVVYSARPGEFAYEKPDGSGGFFTEVLLEALRRPTAVTLNELLRYVQTELPNRTRLAYGKVQMPTIGGDFRLDVALRGVRHEVGMGQGVLRFHTDAPLTALYLNEVEVPVHEGRLASANPGEYRLRAVSGTRAWETEITLRSAGSITLIPDWKPVGFLDFRLPPAATVELRGPEGELLLLENSGRAVYLQAGTWQARQVSPAYSAWEGSLIITAGATTRLEPALRPQPGFEKTIRLAALEWERENLAQRVRDADRQREGAAWMKWGGLVGAATFSLGGAGLWVGSELTYGAYKAATTSTDAERYRVLTQVLDVSKLVSLGLGAAGLALWGTYEVLYPSASSLEGSLVRLEQEIHALRAE